MKMLKVNCSFCGKEMDCPESMLNVDKHVCENCISDIPNANLQQFAKEAGSFLEKVDKVAEKLEHVSEKEIEKLTKEIDWDRLKNFSGDVRNEEDLARLMNEATFKGNWQKHIEWIEKEGSPEQKKHDLPLLRRLMKEENEKS